MSGVGKFKLFSVYHPGECCDVKHDRRALIGLPWGKCTDVTVFNNFRLSIVLADDQDKPVFAMFTLVEKKGHGFTKPPAHKLPQPPQQEQQAVALDLAMNALDLGTDQPPQQEQPAVALDLAMNALDLGTDPDSEIIV